MLRAKDKYTKDRLRCLLLIMARIRPAKPEDLSAVVTLLKSAGLPYQDLGAGHLDDFLIAVDGVSVVGAAGLERYGCDALLRSLVVHPECRGTGLGSLLACAAEEYAGRTDVKTIYLLTTTAPAFFARRKYEMCGRDAAPATLQATSEFSTLCPSQAFCMRRQLT